jgi:hypothetical protein
MALIYSWIISAMDTIPSIDGLTDVVSVVHWRRSITDGTYIAETYGIMGCPSPSEIDFTAYADLTQADVEAWLESGLDMEAIDEELNTKLDTLINPPVIVLPLPWASNN